MHGGYGQKKYAVVGAKLSEPGMPVGFIERPERLVELAEKLLCSQVWEEVVVGLALLSGRCVVEVLKTGVIVPKTRYALTFTAYQEQADHVLGPITLPTLVEASVVLSAWQRVRTLMACEELAASQICAQYREQIVQCAKEHFARRVPVASARDWYTPLYAQIYPLIAVRYYCPKDQDPRWFAAIVRGLPWPPSASISPAACPSCQQCQRPCGIYYVGDGVNAIDAALGLRLDQEEVEVLACRETANKEQGKDGLSGIEGLQVAPLKETNVRSSSARKTGELAADASRKAGEGKRASAEKSLKEVARQCSHFTEDDWEAYESAVALEACKQIQQEREACYEKQSTCLKIRIMYLDDPLIGRLDVARQREGTSTIDATLSVLLDAYEWLHRGGCIPSPPKASREGVIWEVGSSPIGVNLST